jgi:hypothetical protein
VSDAVPPGYTRVRAAGADAVCLVGAAAGVAAALAAHRTLYAYAATHPARRALQGRAPAYAVPLPDDAGDVVVRHAWHGGLLRRLTRDLYAPPTRAPGELRTSVQLRAAGVRTPAVVAYARYPAPLGLRRVDVATRLVPGARDLAAVLLPDATGDGGADLLRAGWLEATAALLGALARAGARHPDLNLKNVLLAADAPSAAPASAAPASAAPAGAGAVRAWVLDVDVAVLPSAASGPSAAEARAALAANYRRLRRSLEKWRRTRGLPVGAPELAALADRALAHLTVATAGAAGDGPPHSSSSDATDDGAQRRHGPARRPRPARPHSGVPLGRVCVVMMSAVGDAVHVLPVLTALRRAAPHAHVTWVLQPGPATLVRGHPASTTSCSSTAPPAPAASATYGARSGSAARSTCASTCRCTSRPA